MTIRIWNDLKKYGFVMTPYTFIRSLGAIKATVLCQILAEYNHANNNQLNLGKCFLSDLNRMANYLGLDINELLTEITELEELNLLWFSYADIKDIYLISVNETSIIEFKEQIEQENMYDDWNAGLLKCQNPTNRLADFITPVKEIQKFIKLTTSKQLPLVLYAYANYIISLFESDGSKFLDLPNIWQDLKTILAKPNFTHTDIGIWLFNKCKE